MQLFSADAKMFLRKILHFLFAPENMKKTSSKVAHNQPRPFFSVLPVGPNPAQISISVP
jgi:hypothetical protein